MNHPLLRLVLLVGAVTAGGLVAWSVLGDDLEVVRSSVRAAGAWGAVVFVVLHVVLSLVPVPRSLLAVVAGALFGVAGGIALSYVGSVLSAATTFALGRRLGREAVTRLAGARAARVDRLLREQGFLAVVLARLTPVAPFVVTSYGAGMSAVRTRDYALGSLAGLVPGSVAWATVGASADADARTLQVAGSVTVLLLVTALVVARRLRARREGRGTPEGVSAQAPRRPYGPSSRR